MEVAPHIKLFKLFTPLSLPTMALWVSEQKKVEWMLNPSDCSDYLSMCGGKIHDSRDPNKMSSCPPRWISTILKARGSLPPVRFSSQLSQDQGSRPLITHPSQNKTARFGALSQRHKVKICLPRKGTQKIHFPQEKWDCSQPKISREKNVFLCTTWESLHLHSPPGVFLSSFHIWG